VTVVAAAQPDGMDAAVAVAMAPTVALVEQVVSVAGTRVAEVPVVLAAPPSRPVVQVALADKGAGPVCSRSRQVEPAVVVVTDSSEDPVGPAAAAVVAISTDSAVAAASAVVAVRLGSWREPRVPACTAAPADPVVMVVPVDLVVTVAGVAPADSVRLGSMDRPAEHRATTVVRVVPAVRVETEQTRRRRRDAAATPVSAAEVEPQVMAAMVETPTPARP
jgi:hypothetical protein